MNNPTKKSMLALICALAGLTNTAPAQTAAFSYNDGNGTPDAGTYHPGDSFTFSITLAFTSGGAVTNLDGLSYWFQQKSPGSPFIASITLRDVTGSSFTDLQTPGLTYPQSLNPSNANDLGAAIPSNQSALGNGSYLVANITVQISDTAPVTGTFVLDETLSGGKTSVISDSAGHTFAIAEADYTITMVPEPGTWVAGSLVLASLLYSQRRRFARR
jgi:hypothetical protein